jgi:hypothetical protein
MLSGLLLAGIAYLIVPGQVTSKNNAPVIGAAPGVQASLAPAISQGSEGVADLPSPRPSTAVPSSISQRIVIDPATAGAGEPQPHHGKEITLDVALSEADGRRTLSPVDARDRSIAILDKRVAFASENKADCSSPFAIGWALPYAPWRPITSATNDPNTLKLTSIENKDSGYSHGL